MNIMKFITTPTTKFPDKLKNIIAAWCIMFVWMALMNLLINYLDPPEEDYSQTASVPPVAFILYRLFFTVILAPLWEELAYRHAPFLLVKALGEKFLVPVVILSSIIFGWGHGMGPESLLRQGVMGFVLFGIYLKNGNSYWSSVALHALWNGIFFLMVFGQYIW